MGLVLSQRLHHLLRPPATRARLPRPATATACLPTKVPSTGRRAIMLGAMGSLQKVSAPGRRPGRTLPAASGGKSRASLLPILAPTACRASGSRAAKGEAHAQTSTSLLLLLTGSRAELRELWRQ